MGVDLDYTVRLKDGRVEEREMIRGELRDVVYDVMNEMNPDWFGDDVVLTEKKDLIEFYTLNIVQIVHLFLCVVGLTSLAMRCESRSINTTSKIS